MYGCVFQADSSSDTGALATWTYAAMAVGGLICLIFIPMAFVVGRRMRAEDPDGLSTPDHRSSFSGTAGGHGYVDKTTDDPAAPDRHFYPPQGHVLIQNPTYAGSAPPPSVSSSQAPRSSLQNATYQAMPQAADTTSALKLASQNTWSSQPEPGQALPADAYSNESSAAMPTPMLNDTYDELGNYGELQGRPVSHLSQAESMHSEGEPGQAGLIEVSAELEPVQPAATGSPTSTPTPTPAPCKTCSTTTPGSGAFCQTCGTEL